MDSAQKIPLHISNAQLNQLECAIGRSYLESMPRHMTIVLGNNCNIDCLHCYQEKNGDNLLRNKQIGSTLRREFMQIYPYLETLRIQGGEIFALKGFKELLRDISDTVNRPLLSTSTNGTLLNEYWCQRIVDTPFQTVTLSLDAATAITYERLRRGASFEKVTSNIKRLQNYRLLAKSWYPNIDTFYVIMRSNFREIPLFLELMLELDIYEVSFQTLLIDERNLRREPSLQKEKITSIEEIKELHQILENALHNFSSKFDVMSFSGLKSLFDSINLDSAFLNEENNSILPCQKKKRQQRMGLSFPKENTSGILFPGASIIKQQTGKGQCPNPWTTLFVTENGNVSLCFLSEPVDNLYKTPLSEIWNCRQAVAKRSRILAGYYTESGCSKLWCDWRNGKVTTPPNNNDWQELLNSFRALTGQLKFREATSVPFSVDQDLSAVRRILKAQENRIAELESNLQLLWSDNTQILTFMEKRIYELKAKLSGTKKITTSVFDLMWIHWLWMRKIWHHLRIFWTKFRH